MKMILVLINLFLTLNSYSKNIERVVYGDDNRQDIYNTNNDLYKKLAKSTAAMIPTKQLSINGNQFIINSGTLRDDGVCLDEKFSKQPTAAVCSGFLVGPKLLVTAGHCITNQLDCDQFSWVFNYGLSEENSNSLIINKNDVYNCTKIISRTSDDFQMNDYALIELDRDVIDRSPLRFRLKGKIENNQKVFVIGHPSGLPTKIADGAFVRSNNKNFFFQTNLDTFEGNSGSAVFNSVSGEVEGILVRGETDYVWDEESACNRVNHCSLVGCRGEDVTRINAVKGLQK